MPHHESAEFYSLAPPCQGELAGAKKPSTPSPRWGEWQQWAETQEIVLEGIKGGKVGSSHVRLFFSVYLYPYYSLRLLRLLASSLRSVSPHVVLVEMCSPDTPPSSETVQAPVWVEEQSPDPGNSKFLLLRCVNGAARTVHHLLVTARLHFLTSQEFLPALRRLVHTEAETKSWFSPNSRIPHRTELWTIQNAVNSFLFVAQKGRGASEFGHFPVLKLPTKQVNIKLQITRWAVALKHEEMGPEDSKHAIKVSVWKNFTEMSTIPLHENLQQRGLFRGYIISRDEAGCNHIWGSAGQPTTPAVRMKVSLGNRLNSQMQPKAKLWVCECLSKCSIWNRNRSEPLKVWCLQRRQIRVPISFASVARPSTAVCAIER